MTPEQKFMSELKELFKKYNVRVEEAEEYNFEEEYCGSTYWLRGPSINVPVDEDLNTKI